MFCTLDAKHYLKCQINRPCDFPNMFVFEDTVKLKPLSLWCKWVSFVTRGPPYEASDNVLRKHQICKKVQKVKNASVCSVKI